MAFWDMLGNILMWVFKIIGILIVIGVVLDVLEGIWRGVSSFFKELGMEILEGIMTGLDKVMDYLTKPREPKKPRLTGEEFYKFKQARIKYKNQDYEKAMGVYDGAPIKDFYEFLGKKYPDLCQKVSNDDRYYDLRIQLETTQEPIRYERHRVGSFDGNTCIRADKYIGVRKEIRDD